MNHKHLISLILPIIMLGFVLIYTTPTVADTESDELAAQKSQLDGEVNRLTLEAAHTQEQIAIQQSLLEKLSTSETQLVNQNAEQNAEEENLDLKLDQLGKESASLQFKLEESQVVLGILQKQLGEIKAQQLLIEQQSNALLVQNKMLASENNSISNEIAKSETLASESHQKTNEIKKVYENESSAYSTFLKPQPYLAMLDSLESDWLKLAATDFGRAAGEIPSSAMGSLITPHGICTAFLVAPDRIRTAAHCIHEINELTERSGYVFTAFEGTQVAVVYQNRYSERTDLIELKLKSRVELEIIESASIDKNLKIQFYAYDVISADFIVKSCDILSVAQYGAITTNCPSLTGMSGAPYFQNGKVVGFHIGRLGNNGVGMIFEPAKGQEFSDLQATQIQYEYNCDSNCNTDVGFEYPCPTLRKPLRTCHETRSAIDPICEAAKQNDCVILAASREAERSLNRLKEGLRDGLGSLGIQTAQLKLSVDGLRTSLNDVGNAVIGKNESIKILQTKILDSSARIDSKRAELTRKILLVDESTQASVILLQTIGASKTDIENVKSNFNNVTQLKIETVSENTKLKELNESLKKESQNISNRASINQASLIDIGSKLTRLREEAANSITSISKKIADMPIELALASLSIPGADHILFAVNYPAAYKKLENFCSKKGPEINKWVNARLKTKPAKNTGDCYFDDLSSQNNCLAQKSRELAEKKGTISKMMNEFRKSVQAKLSKGTQP